MEFTYHAKKVSGEDVSGTMEAKDKFELGRMLRQMGYLLISCEPKKTKKLFSLSLFSFGGVSVAEKMTFSRNLSVMISAGLPITRALEILNRQVSNKFFQKILFAVMEDVKKGIPLSESMCKYPKIFPGLFTAMVKVGEESGTLSASLALVGQQLEKDYKLMKKIKGAMTYPIIVVIAMIGISIFLLAYVVPTLISTFKELNIELPMSTKVIIALSDFLMNHTVLVAIIFLSVVTLCWRMARTSSGKRFFDFLFLNIPIISPLVKQVNASRTTRTLSSLLTAGISIVDALSITRDVVQNSYYKQVLERAKTETQKGEQVSKVFKAASKFYPMLVGEMMSVGEETGELSKMLSQLATFYEEEVDEATKNLSTVVEPVLMLVIGASVGFFAVSMLSPMYSMASGI